MVIDWTLCKQPDLQRQDYINGAQKLEQKYLAEAKKSSHIAVGLNKVYGVAVQERRDHVRLNYVPIGPKRAKDQCALSDANYERLLQYRDASYYVMCRGEVGIGTSPANRLSKDLKSMTFAAIYDLAKASGFDMRAKPNEPTTPPGGFAACRRGAADGKSDPVPTPEDVSAFKTRLVLSDSERAKLGDPTKQ